MNIMSMWVEMWVQIMKEIEQQQIVRKRHIVVHEQHHEHIQQVQQ